MSKCNLCIELHLYWHTSMVPKNTNEVIRMNKENRELNFVKIEATGFQDLCNRIAELEAENSKLILENERLTRMKNGLKLNNSKLTQERNDLIDENFKRIEESNRLFGELQDIKSLSMFEFADKYCNDDELEKAGRQLAHELITARNNMTNEDLAIEAAENCHVPYSGDDF